VMRRTGAASSKVVRTLRAHLSRRQVIGVKERHYHGFSSVARLASSASRVTPASRTCLGSARRKTRKSAARRTRTVMRRTGAASSKVVQALRAHLLCRQVISAKASDQNI